MTLSLAPSPIQATLGVDLIDLLILERAALDFQSVDRKAFSLACLDYVQQCRQALSIGEFDRRVKRLVDAHYLLPKGSRWVCTPEWAADVAAHAALQKRLAHFTTKSISYYMCPSAFESGRYLHALLTGNLSPPQAAPLIDGFKLAQSLAALPEAQINFTLLRTLPTMILELADPGVRLQYLESQDGLSVPALTVMGEHWLMQNRRTEVKALLRLHPGLTLLQAQLHFLDREFQQAHALLSKSLENARHPYSTPWTDLVLILTKLALGKRPTTQLLHQAEGALHPWLNWLTQVRSGKFEPSPSNWSAVDGKLGLLLVGAAAIWEGARSLQQQLQQPLRQAGGRARQAGYALLSDWFEEVATGQGFLPGLLPPSQSWKRALDAMEGLFERADDPAQLERLVWVVECSDGRLSVDPKVQKRGKKEQWTPGRSIAYSGSPPNSLSQQDQRAFELIRHGRREEAMAALVGHPHVYHEGTRVEVVPGQPELRVHKNAGMVELTLEPSRYSNGLAVATDGPKRLRVVRLNGQLEKIARFLGADGLTVPQSEEVRLQKLLTAMSASLGIASDVSLDSSIEEREPDPRLYLRLAPYQTGLQAMATVRPFGPDGPAYAAAVGPATLVTRFQGRTVQTVRDLTAEGQAVRRAGLPDDGTCFLAEPLASLELLERLETLDPQNYLLEWPEGKPFKIKQRAGLKDFSLRLQSQADWFEVAGEVKLEGGEELKVERLLELLRHSGGRFLSLGSGDFLALSEELRQRLQQMADLLEPARGKKMRLHPLAAGMVSDLPGLKADRQFRDRLQQLKKAQSYRPQPPSTFQAELRDYQQEGFEWLAQRAEWGVGACLADDMGLGKTIQALALLVLRAPHGPALVVAPTSVTGNWLAEAERFAPTLRVRDLRSAERQALLSELGPFDVVVASYGLLLNEISRLEQVEWQTVVLDEAQAIKNTTSQRYQAANRLQARARLATTGTPVENRLDELWALFRFLNPGLLGSQERFRERFAVPIEGGDRERRDTLRRLVHPFLLRRTKGEVLKELPPRTEVTLEIELSPAERVFYEALRRQALENLQGPEVEPLSVLTELTRLRRACCHPSLVKSKHAPPQEIGSKLEAMLELLEEVRQGGHRALVFSQFVDHLELIRGQLERHQFTYLYLDGSTPARQRPGLVARFQAGEGDVFLISLKAGGTGLNLTGADYVLHMDPWWNPAVEDQASDRSHRIGQTRPVTIYRLVASRTVEDKIVGLHRHKRELAQTLLEGADGAARLDAAELLRLLREH